MLLFFATAFCISSNKHSHKLSFFFKFIYLTKVSYLNIQIIKFPYKNRLSRNLRNFQKKTSTTFLYSNICVKRQFIFSVKTFITFFISCKIHSKCVNEERFKKQLYGNNRL